MNDLLGSKPYINPVATISSTGLHVTSSKRSQSESKSIDSDCENTPKRSNNTISKNQLSNKEILLQIHESKETFEKTRERRHQEKMKQRSEAIEVMKQIVTNFKK